jgi:hypothetical protein
VAAPRRFALAGGAFAAAAGGREGELDWFLQRMGEEDEPHQRGILDRTAQLRRNRLGEASVERSLQLMQDRALELKGAPDWMVA